MSRLQNLYTQLMREPWLRSWHDNYKAFYEEVEDIRDRINKGESSFPDTDRAFLRKLLYEKKNGVASRGQSILSDNNFKLFIEKKEFISSLQKLILEPNKQNWKDFGTVWSDQKKGNRPLLVNRVAAACTLKVSTTVDVTRFYQVFKWLMDEKIIEPTEEELKKMPDWFSINQFLMEFMHREFSGELEKNKNDPANNKIDKFYLSMFVWRLYENVSERPFSLKKTDR